MSNVSSRNALKLAMEGLRYDQPPIEQDMPDRLKPFILRKMANEQEL